MSKPDVTAASVRLPASLGETFEGLIGLLEREFELRRDEIHSDSHLVDDLDLDSLDFVALAAAIEEEWDCSLEPEDVSKVSTVEELVQVLDGIRAQGE